MTAETITPSGETICPHCGLRTPSNLSDCTTQWNLLLARNYSQPALFGHFHNAAVDTYCLQHPPYVESAKSLAAHLCGLCIAIEYHDNATMRRQLQQWLSRNPKLHKPELPSLRGPVTIGNLYGISNPAEFGQAVARWMQSVWKTYGALQPLAREWLALSQTK